MDSQAKTTTKKLNRVSNEVRTKISQNLLSRLKINRLACKNKANDNYDLVEASLEGWLPPKLSVTV